MHLHWDNPTIGALITERKLTTSWHAICANFRVGEKHHSMQSQTKIHCKGYHT